MKTIYQIIFDNGSNDEASNGLENWLDSYLSMCANDDLTPNEVKAICYNSHYREVYFSDEAVDSLNSYIAGGLGDVRQAVIDNAIYQQELRRDYYQGQL